MPAIVLPRPGTPGTRGVTGCTVTIDQTPGMSETMDPVWSTGVLLLIAAARSPLLLVLIIRLKLHAFLSLVLVSLLTAIATGVPLADVPGVCSTASAPPWPRWRCSWARRDAGAAAGGHRRPQVLADTLIGRFGEKRAPLALGVAPLLFGFPIFFDAGLVVFLPIILTVARRFGGSLLFYALPAAGAFAAMHALVPPHPGPVAAADAMEGDIGLTLLLGSRSRSSPGTSASTCSPSGPARRFDIDVPDALLGEVNAGRDGAGATARREHCDAPAPVRHGARSSCSRWCSSPSTPSSPRSSPRA